MTAEAFGRVLAEVAEVAGTPSVFVAGKNQAAWASSDGGAYLWMSDETGQECRPFVVLSTELGALYEFWIVDGDVDGCNTREPTEAVAEAIAWLSSHGMILSSPAAPSTTTKKQRKAIPKAVRFAVFKRDKFTCQYCGAKAPDVVLECDHIIPHSLTQDDSILNLVTACHPCNNGKSNKMLSDDSVVTKQHAQLTQLQERRDQLEMMMEWQRGLAGIDAGAVDALAKFYEDIVPGQSLTDTGRASIQKALSFYPAEEVATILRETINRHLCLSGGVATTESVDIVARVFFDELKYRHRRKRDPDGNALLYIRGIVRKRVNYWSDSRAQTCLNYLRDALEAGVPVDWMQSFARSCFDWSHWVNEMTTRTEEARSVKGTT